MVIPDARARLNRAAKRRSDVEGVRVSGGRVPCPFLFPAGWLNRCRDTEMLAGCGVVKEESAVGAIIEKWSEACLRAGWQRCCRVSVVRQKREAGRQIHRQADRQTDTQTDRQADRYTDRQAGRQIHSQAGRQAGRHRMTVVRLAV